MFSAAGIFFTDGKKVLLLKRATGDSARKWCLPGGGRENHETFLQTAEREAKEECGLQRVSGRKFGDLPKKDWVTVFFEVQPFKVRLSREHTDWKWVLWKDLRNYQLHPNLKLQMPENLRFVRRHLEKSFREWVAIESVVVIMESQTDQ